MRDQLDKYRELDGVPAGRGDTEAHIISCSLLEERTEPLLVLVGPGPVGVGQLPPVIDQVVSQTEQYRALGAITEFTAVYSTNISYIFLI